MIETFVDEANALTVHLLSGHVTADQMLATSRERVTNRPTEKVMWVCGDIDLTVIPTEVFRLLAQKGRSIAERRVGGKTAAVFRDKLGFGLGRVFQAYAQLEKYPMELEVFKDAKTALAWLGVSPESIPPKFLDAAS